MKTRYLKEIFQFLTILFFLFSCNKNETKIETLRSFTSTKDSTLIPEFKVEVNLSEKAKKVLDQKKETIVIIVEFVGVPEVHIPEKYKYEFYNELGEIILGRKKVELKNQEIHTFNNLKINSDLIKLLKNNTYNVNLDVISGRKSDKNNLLESEHINKSIDSVKNQIIKINTKLIDES